ncbi:MAG: ABC transporter ATP-binding protein [Gemmatimonadaceae bacterium]|nr:ABC transporter ATP-binding protein [Gemmatimonadaceae bacterium]
MATKRTHSDLALYRRLLRLARPYWGHLVALFSLSLLASPLALLTPLPVKIVVDSVLGSHPLPGFLDALAPSTLAGSSSGRLILAVSLVAIIALIGQLRDFSATLLRTYTGQEVVLAFRSQLFSHAQRLSMAYHDRQGPSDLLYRIQWDAPSIQYIAIDGVIPFVSALLTVVTMLYVTILIDWQLAVVALVVAPLLAVITQVYRSHLRNVSREVHSLQSAAHSVLHEALGAVRVVKAFGQETRESDRFALRTDETMKAQIRLAKAEGGLGLLGSMTTALGTALVLFIGARHVQSGELTLGSLLLVMSYLAQLYGPMRAIGGRMASMQRHLASAERAFALLDESHEVEERPNAIPIGRATGAIALSNVSFGYSLERGVLRDVSFDVPAGTRVGIAGATGAGKTTLVSLLTRFYDPTHGAITLDGVDLRDYRLADLRNQFALVLQDTVLFSTSIAENIAYARAGATREEVIEAAKAASAHEFITNLPEGYDSVVGVRGMTLSGGERQRISLARAFLKDAPILVLDEPTSSVDVKTEESIMEAMGRLMHGRTSFMIAHRLSTLANCDIRLEVDNGSLVRVTGPADPAGAPLIFSADVIEGLEVHEHP